MSRRDRGNPAGDRCDLSLGKTGVWDREEVDQLGPVEREALVIGESIDEIVVAATGLAHGERGSDRVLLDHLVGLFATSPGLHRGHQDASGAQERQVPLQLAVDDGRVGAELVEHREKGFEQAVDSEERIR